MTTRIGILGFAHGHVGVYCQQWRMLPEQTVRLVAGWDHDRSRLDSSVQKFGIAAEPSDESLLGRKDIDTVVIGAETSLHAELVERSAQAGKRILLQKPLALTLQEADRIVEAVERTGVPFTLAWQMRVDPQNLWMKQRVDERALGRVLMVRRRHGLSTQLWEGFEASWHVRPELNRGMFADDACHAIDFLYWMLGMPRSVVAEIGTLLNPKVPDDNGVAIFRFDDGTIAEVGCSFTAVAGENTTEITCENGVIIQNYGDAVSCGAPRPAGAVGLKWITGGSAQWTESGIDSPRSHGERIAGLAMPLLEFCQGRRPPIATAREGRDVLAMTLGCYQSSQAGRRVMF